MHQNAPDVELLIAFIVLLEEALMISDCAQLRRLKVQRPITVMALVNLMLMTWLTLIVGLV